MGDSRPRSKSEQKYDSVREMYNARRRAVYAASDKKQRARRPKGKDQTADEDQSADEKQSARAEARLEKRTPMDAAALQMMKERNVDHQLQMTLAEFGQGFSDILTYVLKPRRDCHNPKPQNVIPHLEYMFTLKLASSLVLGHVTDEHGYVLPIPSAVIDIAGICKGNFCGVETWNWAAGIFMLAICTDGSDWRGHQWVWSTSETGIMGKMSIWDVNPRCPHRLESCLKNTNLEIFFCRETMTSNVTYHLEWKCAGQYVIPTMNQVRDQTGRSISVPKFSHFGASENYDFDPADPAFGFNSLDSMTVPALGFDSFNSMVMPAMESNHAATPTLGPTEVCEPLFSEVQKRQFSAQFDASVMAPFPPPPPGQKSSSVLGTSHSLDTMIVPAMELDHVGTPSLAPAGDRLPLFSEAQKRQFNAQFDASVMAPFPPPPPGQKSSSALDTFHFSAGFNPIIVTGKQDKPVIGNTTSNSPLSTADSPTSSASYDPSESTSGLSTVNDDDATGTEDIDMDATPTEDVNTDATATVFGSYRETPGPTMSSASATAAASPGHALYALRAYAALYPDIPKSEHLKALFFINGRGRVSKTRDHNPRCLRCRARHWATCSRGMPCEECRRAGAKCVYGVGDGHDREY